MEVQVTGLTVAEAVAVQLLLLVTVTTYVPEERPVTVDVVWPLLHK